jgi:predicted DCC family thiol-disulfide oxidoreductase YuxK
MKRSTMNTDPKPILLYNDECGVCRRIAAWVKTSARGAPGGPALSIQPIGDDPSVLRSLNAGLDIWDAYETIHILMPDGSMKTGGEAVAEVLRRLPNTAWFAWTFAVGVGKFRPSQLLLDLGYTVLAGVRPLLGCESCGTPTGLLKPLATLTKRFQHPAPLVTSGPDPHKHFTARTP